MARNRLSQAVDRALVAAANRYGLDPDWLRRITRIESGWNPTARRGSYEGLFQLSRSEFQRVGGTGDRTNLEANAMAGAALLASHRDAFRRRYGTEPTIGELYLIHQQGWGGYQAHRDNPDAPAWQNMAGTGEGRRRGPAWARRAIWDNVPRGERGRFGNVGNITSRDFMNLTTTRVSDTGGLTTPPTGTEDLEEAARTFTRDYNPLSSSEATRLARTFPGLEGANVTMEGDRPPTPPPTTPPSSDRPPPTTTSERGFFDRNYPLMHALTGQDRPLLSSIFGEEGLSTNKRLGNALSNVGRSFVESANRPLPRIDLGLGTQQPEQETSAFVLPERRRRRQIEG